MPGSGQQGLVPDAIRLPNGRRLRLAERREGVWMRPANVDVDLTLHLEVDLVADARPSMDDHELAGRLWDLSGWAGTARHLIDALRNVATKAQSFTAVAAVVRHLLDDPALPTALVPAGHPADELRRVYARFRQELLGWRSLLPDQRS